MFPTDVLTLWLPPLQKRDDLTSGESALLH
jgi:hypothetical protein